MLGVCPALAKLGHTWPHLATLGHMSHSRTFIILCTVCHLRHTRFTIRLVKDISSKRSSVSSLGQTSILAQV